MAGNGQTVIDLGRKRMQAMAAKDIVTLEALLADDLVYTHSSARLDTKQSLIVGMTSGSTVYTAVEPSDVKAQDIVELDLRGVLGYTDYFVVATGGTDRQVKAIHDRIHENMKREHGLLPRRVEGVSESRWILMDYLDVIVHIFTPEAREYYRLEQLWGEAPKREIE